MISIIRFIYQVADAAILILMYAIVIRALLSWIPHSPQNPIFRLLYEVTDPLLKPFQRFQIGGGGFGIDLSPIFAYFALYLIRDVLLPLIYGLIIRGY